MQTFVIAGTGASQGVASVVYRKLADALDAEVIALPKLGLGACRDSVKHVRDIIAKWSSGPVALVGHSQGGTIAVGVANDFPVAKVVTLGAPLVGCPWAPQWSPFQIGVDLAPYSDFLTSLNGDMSMLAIRGAKDVVVPARYAFRYDMAYTTAGVGHMGLMSDNSTIDTIGEWLDDNSNISYEAPGEDVLGSMQDALSRA